MVRDVGAVPESLSIVRDDGTIFGVFIDYWDLETDCTIWTVLGDSGLWLWGCCYGLCAQSFIW